MATKKPHKGNFEIDSVDSWVEAVINVFQTGSYLPFEIKDGSIVFRKSFTAYTITKKELIYLSHIISSNISLMPYKYRKRFFEGFFLNTEFSKETDKIFDEFLNFLQKEGYTITDIVNSPSAVSFEFDNITPSVLDEIITACITLPKLNLNFFGNISPEQKATIMHYLSQIYFLKYGARLEIDDLDTFEYSPVTSPELVR